MTVNQTNEKQIACVTGASGMIGSRIVEKLLVRGYSVRVLTRRPYSHPRVEVFHAGLSDEPILDSFISGADLVFHCAAELRDEAKMHEVNVLGTERIARLVECHHIKYFCHLSSAGVIGKTSSKWVDEHTTCVPQNTYERTKYAAELYVNRSIPGCSTIILRPTNVVDENHIGELRLPMSGTFKSMLIAFVKGRECAHIVHAEDVADAAMFFIENLSPAPRTFFVSMDRDPLNTVANLWSLYRQAGAIQSTYKVRQLLHLPLFVPYIIRRMSGRKGNLGDVRYSTARLIDEGFEYSFDVKEIVNEIILYRDRLRKLSTNK